MICSMNVFDMIMPHRVYLLERESSEQLRDELLAGLRALLRLLLADASVQLLRCLPGVQLRQRWNFAETGDEPRQPIL